MTPQPGDAGTEDGKDNSGPSEDAPPPLTFDQVRKAEAEAGYGSAEQSFGLALSGGGIRSATFNLGVIQALAELRLLRRFDYLSTISGGGYIGAWLSMFICKRAQGDVERAEAQLVERDGDLEHPAIRFLRSFSNYLTPRTGFSGDALTAVATYLRNLLLNLSVLLLFVAAALLVPRVVVQGVKDLLQWTALDAWFYAILVPPLLVTTFVVALNLFYRPARRGAAWPWYTRSPTLAALVDVPVLFSALFITANYIQAARDARTESTSEWVAGVTVAYAALWLIGGILAWLYPTKSKQASRWIGISGRNATWVLTFLLSALCVGVAGGYALYGIARAIAMLHGSGHLIWVCTVLGPPVIIAVVMLMIVGHVGLMARRFTESDREVWSVLGGRLLRVSILWILIFGIAIYGPAAIEFANAWVKGLGGIAWIASTLFGVLAGSGKATGKPDSKTWVERLTRIAPHVFLLGLLLTLSWAVHNVLAAAYGAPPRPEAPACAASESAARPGPQATSGTVACVSVPPCAARDCRQAGPWDQFLGETRKEYPRLEPPSSLPAVAVGLALVGWLLSLRIKINLFSLHHFYRNRLTRCYLGATNADRRAHPLTGFDPADDIPLYRLRGQRPLPVVGTAINLNRGNELAWQNRRAASFAFTPYHAGYEPASNRVTGGYRDCAQYGRDSEGTPIQLGTVVAISGAAASPNQGFHTSPAVAFLLTVFNVRLGHWCGNTSHPRTWQQRDPSSSLRYWWAELTGSADHDPKRFPFVNLSDGGHFENLGVYELVRRRCALILASDAGADPTYVFDDLAEAMRKCYTDFGVAFRFHPGLGIEGLRPDGTDRLSARHFAVADIVYPGTAFRGVLVYWKSSLTPDMPPDIMHYRRTHDAFPHESTADQFFDESQFESYRHLGYEVATRSIAAMRAQLQQLPPAVTALLRAPDAD